MHWFHKHRPKDHVTLRKFDGQIININISSEMLGDPCAKLLVLHALTGCDSLSFPFGKGKVNAIKIFKTNCPSLGHIGSSLLYGAQTYKAMHDLRYNIYTNKRDKAPKLKTLPPTDENLSLHVLLVHLQAMIWNAVDQDGPPDVNIEHYGSEIKNGMSLSVAYNGPPAPPSIMKVIACGCNLSRYATNACSCRVAPASCM